LENADEKEIRGREDAEIVRRVLAGDRESFRVLVEKYQRFAIGLAFGMVNNEDSANEIAQDSMVKAFENLGKLQEPSKFHSWLFGIIKNTSLIYLKKRRRGGNVSLDGLMGGDFVAIDPKDGAADEKYIEEQRKQAVWAAIQGLGEKYRDVIIMFHFYSKSYEEIGAVLGLEQKGVDSRLHRARIMLRDKLKDLINE
jgi:RNA polymerase sigma-70 factor (ECF subfamily)